MQDVVPAYGARAPEEMAQQTPRLLQGLAGAACTSLSLIFLSGKMGLPPPTLSDQRSSRSPSSILQVGLCGVATANSRPGSGP